MRFEPTVGSFTGSSTRSLFDASTCAQDERVSELRADELRAESRIARTIELRPESTVPTSSAVNSANSWKPVMPPM